MLAFPYKTTLATALLAAACAALPAGAAANHKPKPFDAVATISACKDASITVATEIAPSENAAAERVRRKVLRKVRGARLKLRFEAMPLYGEPARTDEMDVGKTLSTRRFEAFNELPANTYSGVVRYRWMKGKRTVYSGLIRSKKAKAAGRRGKAFCSLKVGKPPQDTTAPFVTPIPYDTAWKRGPLDVFFYAVDDLSGVAGVFWRLDGGPFNTGRAMKITTEGTHTLQYVARDVAGNQSRLGTATLRVDLNPPTSPTISSPQANVTDTTPDITWTASTDSASGVAFYYVLVRNASNAIVFAKPVAATDPTTVTVTDALPTGQYTAEVIAIDGATPQPFSTTATSSFAVIDPAAPAATDSDGDGRVDGADNCPFVSNADQADLNADGSGDACDDDDDGDGDLDTADNCPTTPNGNQANTGGSAAGDACEDRDSDSVLDATDNCPNDANANQANADGDAQGDVCDTDVDGDGVNNTSDLCDAEPASNPNGCPSPSVTGSSPAAGGSKTYAQRKDDLTVTFNRPMTESSLDAAISLTRGATPVSRTVSCNSPCTTATINPGEDLGGSYTLAVSTGATSAEGNALSPAYSANFSASPFSTDFSDCTGVSAGGEWECAGGQLRALTPDREPGLGGSTLTSVATTAPVAFETAGADAMRITYDRTIVIDDEVGPDELQVEVLVDGNPTGASKTYTDLSPSSSGSDTLAFTATTGSHNYSVRFTLRIGPDGLGPNDAGDVTIDNLTLGRTP